MDTKKRRRKPKKLRKTSGLTLGLLLFGLTVICFGIVQSIKPQASTAATPAPPVTVAAEFDMVTLPCPVRAVARGERLSSVEFSLINWPKSRVTEDYVHDLTYLKAGTAITSLPAMLPIPRSAISSEPLDTNVVAEGIPEGMRAITVRVDAESAVEGWARSGNYVDVIVLRGSKDPNVGLEAKLIAENVRILSAGRSASQSGTGTTAPQAPTTITLLVNQEDALKIKTASNIGKLTFALRGTGDTSPAVVMDMNQRRLLGDHSSRPQAATPPQFKGYARDPEGKVYVLTENSRWIRKEIKEELE